MKKIIIVGIILIFLVGVYFILASRGGPEIVEVDRPTEIGDLKLMVGVLNSQSPETDIEIFRKYVKQDDIVVFPANIYPKLSQFKKDIPGIEIGTGGTSIDPLMEGISRIPDDVDYVSYDYEPDFTPEFSNDQDVSIAFFKQLKEESNRNNMKLVIVPVYIFGKDWDWGEVAENTDVLVVQVQNFQTGFVGPKEFQPETIGMNLSEVADTLVSQVKTKSPSTELYLQMGLSFKSNPEEILSDMELVKDSGIDGITLWHNPGTSGKTSKVSGLEQVLKNLVRE